MSQPHFNTHFLLTRTDKVVHAQWVSRNAIIELLTELRENGDYTEEGAPIQPLDDMTDDELTVEFLSSVDDLERHSNEQLNDLVEGDEMGDIEESEWGLEMDK